MMKFMSDKGSGSAEDLRLQERELQQNQQQQLQEKQLEKQAELQRVVNSTTDNLGRPVI